MLALQRPSMGSSKPPSHDMPFGYSFDTSTSNFPFPSPTAPAPGPSLLDDNESKFLDSFFDGVSNNQFSYDYFTNPPDGSELGLGWDELPPTFMGTTSSYGHQQINEPHHGLSGPNFRDMNPHMNSGPPIPPSTSADVLAAATLLQNGSAGRSHSMGDGALFGAQDMTMLPTNAALRSQSVSQYTPIRPHPVMQQQQRGDGFMQDNFYRDMVFGSQPDPIVHRRSTNQKVDIRWGSDVGFGTPQGFMAPMDQDKMTASERSHIQAVESAFTLDTSQLESSADNTRPSSPAAPQDQMPYQTSKSISRKEEDDQDTRPRKRRKSKFQDEVKEEEEIESLVTATPKQGGKKRKPIKKVLSESPAPDTESGHKRRKSAAATAAAAAAKASRENLTEDQKRENHIKSEQKRRTLIREGFEDLGELVPGLKGGGFSKSAVLIMSADWLEELIQGNQVLQDRLNQMEGR